MADVLVTGATGFTGRTLCRRLVEEGERVVAFVRPSPRVAALRALGVRCREVDIGDAAAVAAAFEPFDHVFHVAAAYRTEDVDRDVFWRINVEATRHLLDAARKVGVGRFVHCSTVGVQGEIEDPPADERYRTKPGDHYQASKLEGERLALEAFATGLPGSVIRPVGIYGPGDTRFLKLFRPISRGLFVMIGDGQVLYHMTYIDDLIEGFVLASRRQEALGEVFTIGGPRYTTLSELVELVARSLDRPPRQVRIPYGAVFAASRWCERLCSALRVTPPLYPRRVEFFALDRAFRIDKAVETLGYRPQVDLPEGLARTARWYREQGWIR